MNIALIIIIISWFLCGVLSMILAFISDMRGKEYNQDYFEDMGLDLTIFFEIIILGAIPLFVFIFKSLGKKHNHILTKMIYKIANIGVKKDTE